MYTVRPVLVSDVTVLKVCVCAYLLCAEVGGIGHRVVGGVEARGGCKP